MSASRNSSYHDDDEELFEGGRPVTIRIREVNDDNNEHGMYDVHGFKDDDDDDIGSSETDTQISTMHILGPANCYYGDDDDDEDGDGCASGRLCCVSRKARGIFVLVCLMIMATILITTSMMLSKEPRSQTITVSDGVIAGVDNGSTDPPTSSPTMSERFQQFYVYIFPFSGDRLDDENSPQFQALKWLVYGDEANLDPDKSTANYSILQRYALATLYYSTDGENWLQLSDTFLSPDPVCSWNANDLGTFCDSNGSVTRVSIVSNGLSGTIPPELDLLHNITTLNLYFNNLDGAIPDLSSLTSLETLDVEGNNLKGSVPSSLFNLPSLKYMYLLNNQGLTGTIPEINNNSSQLDTISLYDCDFTGSIPESLGYISTLRRVQFFNNSMTGTIPSSLNLLPNLETLGLRGNQLKGSLPTFSGLMSLTSLSVGDNMLKGELPELQDLDSLEYLFLQNNQLEGEIPSTLASELPSLSQLWISNNKFDGPLPKLSENSGTLSVAYLNGNRFSGDVHEFLETAPASLLWLDISNNNNLQGSISSSIERFASVKLFNASGCRFNGNLPPEVGRLSRVETLDFSNNVFAGQIPTELGSIASLKHLDLSENWFAGSLPVELGNLVELKHLDVSVNQIGYEFPSALTLLHLEHLSIEKNAILGNLTRLFCLRGSHPAVFTADCDAAFQQCTCCTKCYN